MLGFLHDIEIDWSWPQLTAAERAIVRRHEALLEADRRAYTAAAAEAMLVAVSDELPGRVIRARAADDEGVHGWQVLDGDISRSSEFDEAGMFPDELLAEDFRAAGVAIVRTALVFPDSMLRAIEARGHHHDGSLSALVQGAWQVAADELPAGFRTPDGPRHMQSVYLPVEVWEDIKDRARDEERSMSYVVQRAVTAAYALPVE